MRKVLETVIVEAVGRVDKSLFMELWTDCGKGVGNLVVHGFSTVCPQRNGDLSMLSTAHSLRHYSKCFYLEIFWVTAKSGWKRFCNEPLHFWFLPLLVLLTVMVFFLTKLLPFAQSVINNNAFAWITFERRNTVRFQPGSFSDLKKIRIWTRRWPLAFFAYPADTSGAQRPDKSAFHVFIAVRAFHIHHSPCLACFNP